MSNLLVLKYIDLAEFDTIELCESETEEVKESEFDEFSQTNSHLISYHFFGEKTYYISKKIILQYILEIHTPPPENLAC